MKMSWIRSAARALSAAFLVNLAVLNVGRAQLSPGPYEILPFQDGFINEAWMDLLPGAGSIADWTGWSGSTWVSPGPYDGHIGSDFSVQTGTPLYAAAAGSVIATATGYPVNDHSTYYGNFVRIAVDGTTPNGDAINLTYGHMLSVSVTNGQRVNVGDQVGLSDDTGNSTTEHVHFQSDVRTGTNVCPFYWAHFKYPLMFNPLGNHQVGRVVKVSAASTAIRTDRFDSSSQITTAYQNQLYFASYPKRGYYQVFIPNNTSYRSGWIRATDVDEVFTGTVIQALPDNVTYTQLGQLQSTYAIRSSASDAAGQIGSIVFGGGRFVADQITNGYYHIPLPGASATWGWVKPNNRMVVYSQLTNPNLNLATLPTNTFPIMESFATTGKSMFGRPKFNRSIVNTFSPSSPGGDGKAIFLTDSSNYGQGTCESVLVGKPGHKNYYVQCDVYFNYQPSYLASGEYERYGVFLRDDGFAGLDTTFEGAGNAYALLWDNDDGRIRAARLDDGVVTDFLPTVQYVTGSGWHTLRIEAQGNTIKYLLDGQTLIQTTDSTFPCGQCGIGYSEHTPSYPAGRGAYFDNFKADSLDAPTIVTQPQSQTASAGGNVTFTVSATGAMPMSYQWRFNSANVSGATASSFTKSNVQPSDAGSYSVVVTNISGSVTSSVAVLTVNSGPPSITTQPASQTLSAGANATFTVAASGTAPLSYQWRFDGANISGATASSYTKNNVQSGDVGYYSVVITNSLGSVTSADAVLALSSGSLFSDTFESGNLNNWSIFSGASALTISTAQNHTSAGSYSAYLSTTASKMYHNISPVLGGHSKSTFWIYDSTQARAWAEARSYSGGSYNNGSLQQLYAAGKYNGVTMTNEVYDATKYQGRVLTGANNGWFNLNAAGAPNRSTGWHKFEIEVMADGTTINFYVDGILGRQITGATAYALDDVVIGSVGSGTTAGDAWFDDVSVEYYDLPVITSQPTSQTVNTGSSATFTVGASGIVTGYQWRKNGVAVSGATASSFVLNNVQLTDAGSYSVIVCNGDGPVTSVTATLTVNSVPVPPSITTQPASQTVNQTANATFSVVASGTAPLSYQWTFNGANISGATLSSYTKNNIQPTDAGSYAVVVTNVAGAVTSANATLTVNVPPSITAQPQSQTVNQGANVTFSVTASGTAPLSYQWKFNGGNISGATGSSYTKSNVQATDAGSYSVLVTNMAGSATSANAALTVNVPPTITTQPASQSLAAGANATFSVTATGTAPLSYQWKFNGGTISGATASSYTKSNVQSADAGSYAVLVSNVAGNVTSANAVLTVNNPPTLSLGASRATEQVVSFETMTNYNNDVVMFRKPANSSTTSAFIDTTVTNFSMVTTSFPSGNTNGSGSKVLKTGWTFKTGTTNAWLRLTTANATYIPNPVFTFTGRIRFDIYADKSILVGLGLRETGGSVAVGGNGGTTGAIEWIGVTNKVGSTPLPNRSIAAGAWTTLEFNLPSEPCLSFSSGNGILDGAQGVLEHLAILPNAGLGAYNVYLDNFQMVMTNTLPGTVTMNSGSTLTFAASATDPDAGQTITYSLDSGAPTGASINSSTGAFTWTPSSGNTTNSITVRATDNGVPILSDAKTITVIVNTDPLGVQSAETIATAGAGETLKLTWDAAPGATYQIQYRGPNGTWINAGAPITVTGTEGSAEISGADQETSYRILELDSSAADQ